MDQVDDSEAKRQSDADAAFQDIDVALLRHELATGTQWIVSPKADKACASGHSGDAVPSSHRHPTDVDGSMESRLQELSQANAQLWTALNSQMPINPYTGSPCRWSLNTNPMSHHQRDLVGSLERRVQDLQEANIRMTLIAQISLEIVADLGLRQLIDVAGMVSRSLVDLWSMECKIEAFSEKLFTATKDLAVARHEMAIQQEEVQRLEVLKANYQRLAQDMQSRRAQHQSNAEPRPDGAFN